MKTDLHEKYVDSVVARLKGIEVKIRKPEAKAQTRYDGPPPVATFDVDTMTNVRGFEITALDRRAMIEVPDGEQSLRIDGEGFVTLQKVASEMITKCDLADVVSQDFIEDLLFDYRISALKSNEWNSPINYVAAHVGEAIKECSFSFPLSGSRGNRAFSFCGVDFQPDCRLFRAFISRFRDPEILREDERLAKQRIAEEWSDRFGQCMWASVNITAEPRYAKVLAIQHVTDATHLLRAICVAGYHPTRHVGFVPGAPFFYEHLSLASIGETEAYFPDPASRSEILWFGEDLLKCLSDLGLKHIDNLYRKEVKNEMEELCLRCLITLGSVAGMSDVSDKVVYGCTALDMLYSRDQEPILATMPKRLAIELGLDLAERKSIVAVVKAVYALRSGRVHGGRAAELNSQTLDFFRFLFYLATRLPFIAGNHPTQAAYIGSLEDRMLGGQVSESTSRRFRPIR